MAELCEVCGTDTAQGRSGLCRYCALQRAEPAKRDDDAEALAAERAAARWGLLGDMLLRLGLPAFLFLIMLADRLAHR
jgi:hypothetical protein